MSGLQLVDMPSQPVELAQSSAVAAATAAIQSRYVMAVRRPRSWDEVRVNLLRECDRPTFAKVNEQAGGWYERPVGGGKKASGLSVRFAEAALREAGNMGVEVVITFDDERVRRGSVVATDYERNTVVARDFVVEKIMERKQCPNGVKPLGTRQNSFKETVYLLPADDGAVEQMTAAVVSKRLRVCIEKLLPGWIVDECRDRLKENIRKAIKADPNAARKAIVDNFARVGVRASQLEHYLGHGLEGSTEDELLDLRSLFSSIQEGVCTWAEAMEAVAKSAAEASVDPAIKNLREKLAANREKVEAKVAGGKPTAKAQQPQPVATATSCECNDPDGLHVEGCPAVTPK